MKGIAYYCFKHDQGCLVVGPDIPKNLNKACSNLTDCQWEDIGSFYIENRALKLSVPNKEWFDEQEGGWKIEYFKNNLYDKYMSLIDYHEVIDED